MRELAEVRRVFRPRAAENVERIGRHAAETMIGGTHDKLRPGSDHAELSDDQPVAELRIVEQHVVFSNPVGSAASS